ncbi:molybdopterin synthase sulfur carrier subunit [Lujinxingia litoralis]|uniref:Molybdopterin synthase sulfur carrier subunit n=1 Tax=Lujinxingia litoralis TaxID=2211119 RepID=A0A328CE82_9DELT|nr:ubiquitin-like small modifier protein 1 [Lujinxingia litoralis]RAL25439.1 molybdopterin synthase sulfur carrier subunit [Lujinxingia litoralis]
MTVSIRIPTPLRKFTEGQETVSVEASTVGEALTQLAEAHPGLKSKIFGNDGSVRRFVNIFANEEDIRFQDKLETPLSQGDTVSIVPAIAGGSK